MKRLYVVLAISTVSLVSPAIATADVVSDWNDIAVNTLVGQGQNPFAQARYLAITQLAVFEAVNTITGEYRPYRGTIAAPAGANPDAAAVTAAYRVLKTYFPGAANLDAAYAASLAVIPNGSSKTNGMATGEAAAAQMIALRVGDGASPPAFSLPASTDPGVWQLTPSCPASGGTSFQWQHVTPFGVAATLRDAPWTEAFRPAPPPALSSRAYAKSYEEVMRVGNVTSDGSERPADRATVAQFYAQTSPGFVFNQAARQVSAEQAHSLTSNARAFALINMALSDSLVASFAAKYYYNEWRPETAIRAGDTDGNAGTEPDPGFTPFIVTPCFPSYPSNHASGSGGAAEVLRRLYGNRGHHLVLTSPNIPGVSLTYDALDQITDDIDDARVYGGIHFRFDQDAGSRLGREVGSYIYRRDLRPDHGNDGDADGDDPQ